MTQEQATWRRSKVFRSPDGREWIEIENDDRMICEISNQYLAIAHVEKEDEDIADLMITAVNERDALLSEVARLREALETLRHHLQKQPDVVGLVDAALTGKNR